MGEVKNFKRLLLQSELRIFIFILSIVFFLWPMIAFQNLANIKVVVYWLYGTWLALILFSFIYDYFVEDDEEENRE